MRTVNCSMLHCVSHLFTILYAHTHEQFFQMTIDLGFYQLFLRLFNQDQFACYG